MKKIKTYGLTKYQIKKAHDKLKFNRQFMNSNGVQVDNKIVPFADFVQNSYTNSDRYIAELQHRAWSVFNYAKSKDLSNVFLTLTLPSKWHKLKTFKDKLIKNKKFSGRTYITILKSPIDKKKYKFLNCHVKQKFNGLDFEPVLDFSETIDKYTPHNASIELSKLLKKFFDDRAYKSINKDDRCYFRVTEPHQDGTPHIHMSLFVPFDMKDKIVKALNRLFPAPQSKIETDIDSPVAYLMKYVLKTLDDLRDDGSDISNLTLWYLYHGISRFYTSRTFVSLDVYRRLNGMYTLQNLTEKYDFNEVSVYVYSGTKKIAMIENEYGTIYIPKPVNWSQKLDEADRLGKDGKVQLDSGFETIYKEKDFSPIEISIDGEEFVMYDYSLMKHNAENKKRLIENLEPIPLSDIMHKVIKKPYQMSMFELYEYFENLDIDTVNSQHYMYTRNLMIEKGLLMGECMKLTALEDIQNEFEAEGVF